MQHVCTFASTRCNTFHWDFVLYFKPHHRHVSLLTKALNDFQIAHVHLAECLSINALTTWSWPMETTNQQENTHSNQRLNCKTFKKFCPTTCSKTQGKGLAHADHQCRNCKPIPSVLLRINPRPLDTVDRNQPSTLITL